MQAIRAETIQALLGIAGLDLPPERCELLAKRFGPMLALTSRLSIQMSEIADVAPITALQLRSPGAADGQP